MIVTRSIEFPMGHRLQKHPGLCRHIHGHNYRVVVAVDRTIGGVDTQGMVIDFSDLKRIMGLVFGSFDHSLVLEDTDPFNDIVAKMSSVELYDLGCSRIVQMPFAPT